MSAERKPPAEGAGALEQLMALEGVHVFVIVHGGPTDAACRVCAGTRAAPVPGERCPWCFGTGLQHGGASPETLQQVQAILAQALGYLGGTR